MIFAYPTASYQGFTVYHVITYKLINKPIHFCFFCMSNCFVHGFLPQQLWLIVCRQLSDKVLILITSSLALGFNPPKDRQLVVQDQNVAKSPFLLAQFPPASIPLALVYIPIFDWWYSRLLLEIYPSIAYPAILWFIHLSVQGVLSIQPFPLVFFCWWTPHFSRPITAAFPWSTKKFFIKHRFVWKTSSHPSYPKMTIASN